MGSSASGAAASSDLDGDGALGLLVSLAGAGTMAELSYESLKRDLKGAIAKDPFDATVVTVLGGAFLFYVAEKGHNPKVSTYWDALVFVSTCLSVGYADVFARTPAGKAIASAIMTFGPAMSGALFDAPAADVHEKKDVSPELLRVGNIVVDKLDAVLTELRAARVTG